MPRPRVGACLRARWPPARWSRLWRRPATWPIWWRDGGEQAYLARGIGNDLMTDLSRLPGLRLIAASRAAPDSAAKARYLVSGSVQRESATLRINIRLIDTASNQQLWSERYERPYRDLFKVQDEITRKLTQVLPGKLSDAVRQSLS